MSERSTGLIEESRQRIRKASAELPDRPGIYMMSDSAERVIYVGKAVNLRRRVRSYANPSSARDPKVAKLITRVASVSHMETSSELEALLVESRLIKTKLPMFNRKLIQPESCCYLRMDPEAEIPHIDLVTSCAIDGALYLGPFTRAAYARDGLEAISTVFRLPKCSRTRRTASHTRTCTYHDFNRCSGPCCSRISDAEYRLSVEAAWESLAGRSTAGADRLLDIRSRLIDELRFEDAMAVHKQIKALELIVRNCAQDPLPSGDLAVIAPSYLDRRPVVFLFSDGKLRDRFMVAPGKYPEEHMVESRLARIRTSKKDLLPGTPSLDDLLIIRAYVRNRRKSVSVLALDPQIEPGDQAFALFSLINTAKHRVD